MPILMEVLQETLALQRQQQTSQRQLTMALAEAVVDDIAKTWTELLWQQSGGKVSGAMQFRS